MPNLFLLGPAERKAEKKKKGQAEEYRVQQYKPDLLTGNAERFWPLVVTAGWTSTDKTRGGRETGNTLWSF